MHVYSTYVHTYICIRLKKKKTNIQNYSIFCLFYHTITMMSELKYYCCGVCTFVSM